MTRTLIRHIIDSLNNPYGMFRTLGEFTSVRDVYGEPVFYSGRQSVVFKIDRNGELLALKCFTEPTGLADVYRYITLRATAIVCPTRFLPQEIYVAEPAKSYYIDAVLMPWVAGRTLAFTLAKAAHALDRELFAQLADNFDRLAADLLSREWAHGDLKPQNIIVAPDGAMSLIDFDSLYAPSLPPRGVAGTPNYTHPLRSADDYDKHIDDYSLALISVALHALAREPELYARYSSDDNLLIHPDFAMAGKDECYDRLRRLFADDERIGELCRALGSPNKSIDSIDQIFNIYNNVLRTDNPPTKSTLCSDD